MIYLDNAASTRPAAEVVAALSRAARDLFGNPAAAHAAGAAAARALEAARAEVAAALEAQPEEVVFTSGGTEADAMGVLGAARASRGRHLVVTAFEHPAVMRAVEALVAEGFTADRVAPGADGVVSPDAILAAVRPDTAVVAVMLVQNELGTVQPVAEIARRLGPGRRRPHLHVDAVQGFGLMRLRPAALGADTVALSAHKLHGPRGAGALWLRPGARLQPLWVGGGQERGRRGGTENLPAAVGFGTAAALARAARETGAAQNVAALRDRLESEAVAAVPGARPTVAGAERAPHIASIAFPGLPAEPLLHALEARGVLASAGSACASRIAGPSAALKSIGLDDRTGVLRFSLSRETTAAEVDAAVAALADAARELRPSDAARDLHPAAEAGPAFSLANRGRRG
ncbi:MAG TPA: aminotransferase class V-fold PLP-dependent enzyme [Polyangia bacterium]|nr:aminotransferase class V-fold PLP-dependent enzyme [Polyangia bacterium]